MKPCYISAPVQAWRRCPLHPHPASWKLHPQAPALSLPARRPHPLRASGCKGNSTCSVQARPLISTPSQRRPADTSLSLVCCVSPTLCHPLCPQSQHDPGTTPNEAGCCRGEFVASSEGRDQQLSPWKHPPAESVKRYSCVTGKTFFLSFIWKLRVKTDKKTQMNLCFFEIYLYFWGEGGLLAFNL